MAFKLRMKAYENEFDIPLFNQIVTYVTSLVPKGQVTIAAQLHDLPWYESVKGTSIKFRYLGELLERYEEMYGKGIKEFRTVALAYGFLSPIVTEDMFVGAQRSAFLLKLKRLSMGDVYLQAAQHLLLQDKRVESLQSLASGRYSRTEELLLILCIFNDFPMAYQRMRGQLLHHLGKGRTIDIHGNEGLYAWAIDRLSLVLKNERGKDAALLRALMALYTSHVHSENKHRLTLLDNGYRIEDITYLNQALLFAPWKEKHVLPASIVGERIAIDTAITHLNSAVTHSPMVYDFLEMLFTLHREFEIKLKGNKGLAEAIQDSIQVQNPHTFLWVYKQAEEQYAYRNLLPHLHFNPLEEKWDMLAAALKKEAYTRVFNDQLLYLYAIGDESFIVPCVAKYDSLMHCQYLDSFTVYEHSKLDVFCMLANTQILSVESLFDDAVERKEKSGNGSFMYIQKYVMGVTNRKAFDFLKNFFTKYDVSDLERFFGERCEFDEKLLKRSGYNHGRVQESKISVARDFLLEQEQAELLSWLDDYMFRYRADEYAAFSLNVISDESLYPLVPFEQRRETFLSLLDTNSCTVAYKTHLRKLYFNEEEYAAYLKSNEEQASEHARQASEKKRQGVESKFSETPHDTFSTLLKFVRRYGDYSFYQEEHGYALVLVIEAVMKLMNDDQLKTMERREICEGISLIAYLLTYKAISCEVFSDWTRIPLEVLKNADRIEHERTIEPDNGDESSLIVACPE